MYNLNITSFPFREALEFVRWLNTMKLEQETHFVRGRGTDRVAQLCVRETGLVPVLPGGDQLTTNTSLGLGGLDEMVSWCREVRGSLPGHQHVALRITLRPKTFHQATNSTETGRAPSSNSSCKAEREKLEKKKTQRYKSPR